jgi:hypothetical protein
MPRLGPTLPSAEKVAEAPTSLATATAIARGEALPLAASAPLKRVKTYPTLSLTSADGRTKHHRGLQYTMQHCQSLPEWGNGF